eukprot:PhM_4_TR13625/c0_g1_i1/m.63863
MDQPTRQATPPIHSSTSSPVPSSMSPAVSPQKSPSSSSYHQWTFCSTAERYRIEEWIHACEYNDDDDEDEDENCVGDTNNDDNHDAVAELEGRKENDVLLTSDAVSKMACGLYCPLPNDEDTERCAVIMGDDSTTRSLGSNLAAAASNASTSRSSSNISSGMLSKAQTIIKTVRGPQEPAIMIPTMNIIA